ncbi:hypothetical protein LWI29_030799 [Acer saccharum]|uniref:Uncharacterized protein n=1 Tax=Acer saccharum TaxID=4024 RepID=A0AA39TIM8_ACESA|nr:hypothetical protein LWI29_030799 [Acer saccharum]
MQNPGEPPADKAATQTDGVACSRLKGKEKVGEPFEPVSLSHGTPLPRYVVNETNDAVAPEMPAPPKSIPVPSSTGGGAELRHPDSGSEDPAADLNTRGRRSGNEQGYSPNNQKRDYWSHPSSDEWRCRGSFSVSHLIGLVTWLSDRL